MSMAKFCVKCGNELEENVKFCPNCGMATSGEQNVNNHVNQSVNETVKSKIAAGILGIFFGYLGIHNFYLGYTDKAVVQLLLTLVGWIFCGIGPAVAAIWGFVEGILILCGSINRDAKGNLLSD